MASSSGNGLFSSSDVLFLITFAVGMGAFWLSGYAPPKLLGGLDQTYAISLTAALVIYGAIMFAWAWLVGGRALKGALAAAIIAAVLALISSLGLTWASTHGLNLPVAAIVFGLYVVYGAIFVIGWATAKKLK